MLNFYKKIPFNLKFRYSSLFILEYFFPFLLRFIGFEESKQDCLDQIQKQVPDLSQDNLLPIPEIENISKREFVQKYQRKCIPVVFKGGATNWPAFKKWDFEFFKEHYGEDEVLISNHRILDPYSKSEPEFTNLKTVIENLGTIDAKYARFNPLLDRHPELQKDLDFDWLKKIIGRKEDFHALFIGSKGTKTPIHNAGNDNLFFQIRGRKIWYLWDARAIYFLKPEVNRSPAKNSMYDPQNPDPNQFPALAKVPVYKTILEAGDILYVPSYAWHYVENLDHTIGVAIRWTDLMVNLRNSPLLSFLEAFNTSPNIIVTFLNLVNKDKIDFNKLLLMDKKKKNL